MIFAGRRAVSIENHALRVTVLREGGHIPEILRKGGVTRFEISASKSKVFQGRFGADDYLESGAEFQWPNAGAHDLSFFNSAPASSAYTAHLMDPSREDAFFNAYHPGLNISFGYKWSRADFPWLGLWEENRSRTHGPWNGDTIACGMDFGVSPFPETRRQMIERGAMFGVPGYRWLPARRRLQVRYTTGFTLPFARCL